MGVCSVIKNTDVMPGLVVLVAMVFDKVSLGLGCLGFNCVEDVCTWFFS